MIRHLLRLLWNRRRANVLIAVEILLSFLVLCAVVTMGLYYVDNYRRPLGFAWHDTWAITLDANDRILPGAEADAGSAGTGPNAAQRALVARLLSTAGDLPEVESAAAAFIAPYDNSTWRSEIRVGGKRYFYLYNEATDSLAATLRMNVVRGRWFDTSDDGADWTPAVINLRLAREMFGDEDPVGKIVEDEREPDPASPIPGERTRLRIVGVIDDFRKDGEYSAPGEFLIARNRLDDPSERVSSPRRLLVRVRPGTAADFEEKLVSRLRAVTPDWTFQAEPLELKRDQSRVNYVGTLAASAVVAVFLLIMVALGLTGVLWLHVTQRTKEIGLRRAKGATAANVRRQLVGEAALLTAVATLAGVAIVAQLPVLDVFSAVSLAVYATSIGISVVCIFALTLACAWMPARLASGIEPAEALRYE